MNSEFTGEVLNVIEKSGTKKDGTAFNAWAIVVKEQDGSYPDSLLADFFGDKTVTKPNVGDIVVVHFHQRVSEYNGKFYGQNNLWKVEILRAGGVTTRETTPEQTEAIAPQDEIGAEEKAKLPF
jgi:hypothetical protein